jgi:capsular polysaccharide export protein|tara:strand:+ start:4976 stop:6208 length:1233 start_codon:yes stop_codon:yes gene_type:complete
MKKILIIIDNEERLNFFTKAFEYFEITFLTNRTAIKDKCISSGYSTIFIPTKITKWESNDNELMQLALSSLEYRTGKIKCKEKIYDMMKSYIEYFKVNSLLDYNYIFMWNGSRILERTIAYYVNVERINTTLVFLEISNIKNKLFMDFEGVNYESFFRKYYHKLKSKAAVDHKKYQQWKSEYIQNKLKNNIVPQSKNARSIPATNIHDFLYSFISLSYYPSNSLRVINELIGRIISGKLISFFSRDEIPKVGDYIFLPLQVENDTQLKINGNGYNNSTVIEKALEYCEGYIVVKFHPSENNFLSLLKVWLKYRKNNKVRFCTYNTTQLIFDSSRVLTINSTVGLEALILGKEVTFLGKTLYESFNDESDLAFYINNYLIEQDYFNVTPFDLNFLDVIDEKYEIYRRLQKV